MTTQTKAAALLFLALSAACGSDVDYGAPRVCGTQAAIINGRVAGELERHATVKVGDGCSGVLIAPDVVLTAAHCHDGATYVANGLDTVTVWDRIQHPDYDGSKANDLEILILERWIEGWAVVAIASPQIGAATISGYGIDENGESGVLRIGEVKIDTVTESFVLTSGPTDSCYGDSGGPVYQNGKLVAVTGSDRAPGCGGGAVNAALDAYADWIETVAGGSVVFSNAVQCD